MGIVTWGLYHLSKMTVHQRRELKSEFGGNLYRAGNPIARTVRSVDPIRSLEGSAHLTNLLQSELHESCSQRKAIGVI